MVGRVNVREKPVDLACIVSGFSDGGVPRVITTLAQGLAERKYSVELLTVRDEPPRNPLPPTVPHRILLERQPAWKPRKHRNQVIVSIPGLVRYMRTHRPRLILSGGNYVNGAVLIARRLAGVHIPVIITHHAHLSIEAQKKPLVGWIARRLYPWADAIVGVSHGVADDLSECTHIPRSRIKTIYNPVVTPDFEMRMQAPIDHPWFAPGEPPVVLGIGRLHPQKDFETLLRAFALVRQSIDSRLVILGTGKNPRIKNRLERLAAERGITKDVHLAGYVPDVLPYLSRASVFVLSSAWEGFAMVLVEALACGCPVVSTNCPSGPEEILDGGIYGRLIPIGDATSLGRAIVTSLHAPPQSKHLEDRAQTFSAANAVDQYDQLIGSLILPDHTSNLTVSTENHSMATRV